MIEPEITVGRASDTTPDEDYDVIISVVNIGTGDYSEIHFPKLGIHAFSE